MYFKFFKLHSWGKRSADSRRRFIQRLLEPKGSLSRCAYAYRLPGCRGIYVPIGPVFISPWSTASVPRR